MKTIFFALALSLSMNTIADEKFSCDDLDDMSAVLTEISSALAKTEAIQEGDDVDTGLREVIDGLKLVALVEQESDLNDYVTSMEEGWEKMDGDLLSKGLTGVKGSLNRLIQRDCD
jgi:hypothetical protein